SDGVLFRSGSLLSNGKVFLINANGIVFGEHSVVDTAGFVASTLNISDADFLARHMRFSGDGGAIENRGYVRVRDGGDVMLIAPDITNSGLIRADDGAILLAAGRDVVIESLDFEHVRFRVQAPADRVLNLGRVITTGGAISMFAGTLEHRGLLQANRISRDADGVVRLQASGTVSVSGVVESRGDGAAGGRVDITGREVQLSGARIDVSGDAGGGRARIGGAYQGGSDLAPADRTRLDAATTVRADALGRGDGGEIVVWSEKETATFAALSARGGPGGGDGGLVETSSKGILEFGRPADVAAPAGRPGTWLLDPEDITIGDEEAGSITEALDKGSNVSIKTSDGGDGEGNITVASAIAKTEGGDAALSLDAHNRIDVNAPISSTSGKLDVNLTAGRAIHVNANVSTNGGNFSQVVTELATDIPEETSADEGALEDEVAGDEIVSEPMEEPVQNDVETGSADGDAGGSGEGGSSGTEDNDSGDDEDAGFVESDVEDDAQHEIVSLSAGSDAFKEDLEILVGGDINTDGGDIYIDAGRSGTAGVYGELDASNDSGDGGDVAVLGENVGLFEEAKIDASGSTGGGTVLVGGDQQGKNPDVPNSSAVYLGPDASISADATVSGDGGRVIVFAEDSAKVYGRLSARGGPLGGDGGF